MRLYTVTSASMSPLMVTGDKIIVDESRVGRTDLHDGDVIALRRGDAVVIKRILAMPGETIRGDHRKIYVNDKLVSEPYLAAPNGTDDSEEGPIATTFAPVKIAPAQLFVLGDYRDHSFDSRAAEYKPVTFADVTGKYSMTYWHATHRPR